MKASTITFIASILIIIGAIVAGVVIGNKPSIYEEFAQCTAESGATFFGAFWCPHCLEQKRLFGKAADALPYVECSTPDRSGQTEACVEAGIESYPTWEFANGDRYPGVLSLEAISALTSCTLPVEHINSSPKSLEDIQKETIDDLQATQSVYKYDEDGNPYLTNITSGELENSQPYEPKSKAELIINNEI